VVAKRNQLRTSHRPIARGGEMMFEILLKFGLIALVWSGVGLVGTVIYFIYRSIKDDWF